MWIVQVFVLWDPSQWQNVTSFKRGAIYLLISTYKPKNLYFVIFWEALQFQAAMPQLRTFHMDLHPHVSN